VNHPGRLSFREAYLLIYVERDDLNKSYSGILSGAIKLAIFYHASYINIIVICRSLLVISLRTHYLPTTLASIILCFVVAS
jgi:hypothetical protein